MMIKVKERARSLERLIVGPSGLNGRGDLCTDCKTIICTEQSIK